MKRVLLTYLSLLLLMACYTSPVYAAQITNLKAEIDTGSSVVNVTGSIDTGEGKAVTITILDPEGDLEYVNQTTSGPNGTFAFTYTLKNSSTGTYEVKVGGEGVSQVQQSTFEFDQAVDECFIATACFGSKYHSSVVLLRQFRDRCLLTNTWGTAFVDSYYRYSPPIANFIAHNQVLKLVVRGMLTPLIAVAYISIHLNFYFLLLLGSIMTLIFYSRCTTTRMII